MGPCFGVNDIEIFSYSNIINNISEFGTSYEDPDYTRGTDLIEILAGLFKFKTRDIEVYTELKKY